MFRLGVDESKILQSHNKALHLDAIPLRYMARVNLVLCWCASASN